MKILSGNFSPDRSEPMNKKFVEMVFLDLPEPALYADGVGSIGQNLRDFFTHSKFSGVDPLVFTSESDNDPSRNHIFNPPTPCT
jgi:hypothetical protein